MGKRAEKTDTGEGVKGKKVRNTSDDVAVSEKSKSVGAKCVRENSTDGNSGTKRLVPEQIGNVETRIQDSMVFHSEYQLFRQSCRQLTASCRQVPRELTKLRELW